MNKFKNEEQVENVEFWAFIEETGEVVAYDEACDISFAAQHPEIDWANHGKYLGSGWIYNYDYKENLIQDASRKCFFWNHE